MSGSGKGMFVEEISACRKCARLAAYCDGFQGRENPKYPGFEYWAKPVPGFGDTQGELLIIGLAPGAHGANRTGRPFTGDGAGEILYRGLFQEKFCNRDTVVDRNDGLLLNNVYITNAVKCVPPENRPKGEEKRTCLDWLRQELEALKQVRVVLAMGREAFEAYLRLLKEQEIIQTMGQYRFAHGEVYRFEGDDRVLLATYHFSRYNMNTGVLTEKMVAQLFRQVRNWLKLEGGK